MFKLKIIIPALIVICAAVWWLMPHFSNEDKAYYVALYCQNTQGTDQQVLERMQQLVEGNNQDYALQKRHYSPQLAEHVQQAWHSLNGQQQQQAQQTDACRRILAEKLMIPAVN